jgi:hypothetical protein
MRNVEEGKMDAAKGRDWAGGNAFSSLNPHPVMDVTRDLMEKNISRSFIRLECKKNWDMGQNHHGSFTYLISRIQSCVGKNTDSPAIRYEILYLNIYFTRSDW